MRRSFVFTTQILAVFGLLIVSSLAQNNGGTGRQKSPLDATSWGVVYDVPETKKVKLAADVPYWSDASSKLTLDIYQPPDLKASEKRPAVVFLNAIGDTPGQPKVKHWEVYKSFPRLVAAHGLIGISMESDGARIQENLRDLFEFFSKEGAKHGIDGERIGVYAASANVTQTSQFLLRDGAASNVKAAVLYYGGAPAQDAKLRADLPVLFVLAESDAAGGIGQSAANLWQRVMEAGAPWTIMYASRMPHAFDAFEDTDESRRIIQQTIAFWKSHLETPPQPEWKPSPARAVVAAIYSNNPQKSAEVLQKYIAENPNDGDAYNHYGRMLAQLRRFDEAGAAYEKALALGVGHGGVYNGLGQTRVAQKRWDEAVRYLTRAVELGARNSLVYGQLAYAKLALNRNEEAIKNYEKAFEAGIPPGANTRGIAYYNMASGYARLKQIDKAFEMLNKAIDEGLNNRQTFESDADLAPLRADARFQELLKRLPANAGQ